MEQDSQKREASIGTLLADARSHAALSQADVAARMNLRVGIIQALEKDDFESLPQSTYVRGYLRMYAGIVGLDSGHLVGIYNERHHVEPEYHPRPRPHAVRKSATLWNTVAVVTILASLFVVWQVYVKRQPVQIAEPADSQSEPVSSAGRPLAPDIPGTAVHNAGQTSPPHVKEGVRAEQASPRIEKGGSARVSSGQQVSQGRADDTLPAEGAQVVENEPGGEDSARVSSGQQASQGRADDTLPAEGVQAVENEPGAFNDRLEVLTITCVQDSWVEIRDADSQLLIRNLIDSGVTKEIRGKTPFHVLLGNSPGVVIEINGQRFEHSRFVRSNRVAQFRVPSRLLN